MDHLIISGPCSAETEQQVVSTAVKLASFKKIGLYRAGIWKPRTKPGMFEGVGTVGLKWLQNAKRKSGLPFTVEVANAKHVEEALKHETDVVWIGARTTVNPFIVQEIADALKGTNIPVLVKNPVNPDIELWTGAIERFVKAGLLPGMVHRGFSSYRKTEYRNQPMWQIPIEMKRRFPEFSMICDPSHIAGKRNLIQKISQTSLDLHFNGLMIETHPDPDNALSDCEQQLKPDDLLSLLNSLIWRSEKNIDTVPNNELEKLREQINQIDEELLFLMGERMKIVDKIGLFKKENNITILQVERWNEILRRGLDAARSLKLSEEFIKQYFDAVHIESIEHQNKIMNE
ncbi:MAG: bifunctional 3-deoxy-7-phosphoheptulonate synthase/chorismate mutase type II [Bacteroidetes bacterium]|nr:bifunctional 3-deoxy-7-phosphoheptulonate synthase/chorismate mutase type II [Bacteroidota bacterium]